MVMDNLSLIVGGALIMGSVMGIDKSGLSKWDIFLGVMLGAINIALGWN